MCQYSVIAKGKDGVRDTLIAENISSIETIEGGGIIIQTLFEPPVTIQSATIRRVDCLAGKIEIDLENR